MSERVRIYILDEHADVRDALVMRLQAVPEFEVVGHAGEAEAGLMEVARLQPDVVLVETKRSDGRGLEVVSLIALHGPGIRVIVLTSYPSDWEHWAVRRAGAQHYFLKDLCSKELIEQISQAAAEPNPSGRAVLA